MINKENTFQFLEKLLNIDSPSGYTKKAIIFLDQEAKKLGFKTELNQKGNLIISIPGKTTKTIGIATHVDTLGLMVRSINADGTLAVTNLGGPIIPTLDSEYVRIITREGKVYTGTVLSKSYSIHVHPDASSRTRNLDEIMIKIDEVISSKEDVLKVGINNGDIIAIDPKVFISESGFIKSRFLDDKASVAIMFSVLKYIKENNITPTKTIKFIVSTYEEVGHGASHIPSEIEELLAVDMGCIGLDLACSEYDVSICAKDSSGPYDYEFTSLLIQLAKQNNLNYAVDIYPRYGSDASAAMSAGNNIKSALIGPGVAASHGLERTHFKALNNTAKLILAYIQHS